VVEKSPDESQFFVSDESASLFGYGLNEVQDIGFGDGALSSPSLD
jgi:hypothetical protein